MYLPLNYEKLNVFNAINSPSTIKGKNSRAVRYFERALYQRALSVFKWDLPEEWNAEAKDFFLFCLYRMGFVVVWDSETFGFTFQPCHLKGYDWYYQPTHAIVSNPKWCGKLELGTEAELLKLTPDYCGVFDIINYYAVQLAEITCDIEMSLVNNKVPFAVGVRNKVAGAIVKKAFDMVQRGEPAVISDMRLLKDTVDDEEAIHFLDRNLASQYITDKLLADMRTILNNFNTEIGIPNNPTEKRERLTDDEVNSNNVETMSRCTTWYECLNRSIDKVNRMFPGAGIKVTFNEYAVTNESGERTTTTVDTGESEVDS